MAALVRRPEVKYVFQSGAADDLGGKGHGLAQLTEAGLPVPEWFAVSPQGFEDSLNELQKSALKCGDVHAIRSALETVLIDPTVRAEIAMALHELSCNSTQFAVRSSAVDEDSLDCSFAGQLESYLSVPAAAVAEKVTAVWRSGFTERVLAYRSEKGMPPLPKRAPAVVVQRMVRAESAGVAFSADPVSGRSGIVVICAVSGLATGLVSGESNSDDYHVDRSGKISRSRGSTSDLSGRDARVLTDAQATRIAAMARQIARRLGRPQDIEWAIEGEELYVLQTRPITTLRDLPDPDAVRNIWDNSNITESYSGVTTPLTFSFARTAYEGVYREFCRILKVSEEKIAANDQVFRHMLGLIRGRVYYNLLNWYRVLALLPGFTVNRRFMEQMMGVKEPLPDDVAEKLAAASLRERARDVWHLGRMLAALVWNYLTLDRRIERFYLRLSGALADCVPRVDDMRIDELAAYYDGLVCQLLTRWDAPLLNDFFTMIFHGLLRQLCQRWITGADQLANELVRVQGGMISVEPAVRLREMAAIVAANPELARTLRGGTPSKCEHAIREVQGLSERYDEYLKKFGERCLEELKLESQTLHDDPSLLLRSIGELARGNGTMHASNPEEHSTDSAEQRVSEVLRRHPLRRLIFAWVLRNARERVRTRENLRFERTRVFGRVRSIFVEMGIRLHALDRLEKPRDIFYLQVEEVLGFINGTTVTTSLKELVAARKREFHEFHAMSAPPDRFETYGPVHHKTTFQPSCASTPPDTSGEERHGLGCCAGKVRGRVCLVTDPHSASLPVGSILVAERTDPGWIMLFPAAAGLIVERGSLLSHSAIVSRELGIPSVVSVPGVTKWLSDGDLVEIDGGNGMVRRLAAMEASVA
jgi:phosphohistidine swiveling domain-containing protein